MFGEITGLRKKCINKELVDGKLTEIFEMWTGVEVQANFDQFTYRVILKRVAVGTYMDCLIDVKYGANHHWFARSVAPTAKESFRMATNGIRALVSGSANDYGTVHFA